MAKNDSTSSRFDCFARDEVKDELISLIVDSSFGRGMFDELPSGKLICGRELLGVPRWVPPALDMMGKAENHTQQSKGTDLRGMPAMRGGGT